MKLPQLSVRDLFWLVLVAGLAVGWWVDHRKLASENNALWHEIGRGGDNQLYRFLHAVGKGPTE